MAEKKQQMFIIGVVAFIAIIYFANMQTTTPRETMEPVDWQKEYIDSARIGLLNYDEYTSDTEYYDINHPLIIEIANEIKSQATSQEQAVQLTLNKVFNDVDYMFSEPDELCFDRSAPEILMAGSGNCDTQSIVVIAILRSMKISAVAQGGCVVSKRNVLQSVFVPQVKTLQNPDQFEPLDPDADVFSRGANLLSRNGGLHAWVSYYDTNKNEWVHLEPTLGKFADLNSYDYHIEVTPDNDEKELICTSTNRNYALACRKSDIQTMNQNGLGLAGEVSPI